METTPILAVQASYNEIFRGSFRAHDAASIESARPESDPSRQGARRLRAVPAGIADRRHGSPERVRRGAARSDSRQGRDAVPDLQLLVRQDRAPDAESPGRQVRRGRVAGWHRCCVVYKARRGDETPETRTGRGDRTRLPDWIGLEGLPGHRLAVRNQI